MELKPINPKLGQHQIAKEFVYSSSALQRYKYDIKMQSPYESSGPKKFQRAQMTLNDLKRPQKLNPLNLFQMRLLPLPAQRNKSKLKAGSVHQTNDESLDEIVHNVISP